MDLREVLIVDDSEADHFLSRYRIHQYQPSIRVRSVYDGLEALKVLREPDYRPDLIFLDINMPLMNGLEFLSAYSAEFNGRSSRVVMLSSSLVVSEHERAQAFSAVRGFLSKPLDRTWPALVSRMLAE